MDAPLEPLLHSVDEENGGWTEASLLEALHQMFNRPGYKPPALPSIALEIMELSRRPDVEIDDVVELLERDPIMAGRTLLRTHSPLYAGKMPIKSLRQAVIRLGLPTVRDIVLETSLSLRVFRVQGYSDVMEKLRLHCVAVAHLARSVAEIAAVDPGAAFLAGLLHDIGIAGALMVLGDVPPKQKRPDLDTAWSAIDGAHQAATGFIADAWKVPTEIAVAMKEHHAVGGRAAIPPLAAVVAIADDLAQDGGFGVMGASAAQGTSSWHSVDAQPREALRRRQSVLNIDEPRMAYLRTQSKMTLEKVRADP